MTADTVGGVWTYAMELAHAFAPHGVEVSLATMGPRLSPAQRQEVGSSPVVAVYESEFALEWMDEPWEEVDRAGEWLLEVEQQARPDVVHLNGYTHAPRAWRAPTVVAAHSCVLSWWAAVRGEPAPPAWSEYRTRVQAGLAAADGVVAPTASMLGELHRWYGFGGGTVVTNCRRADWVQTRPKEHLVLGAGRVWDEAKNVAALGRAAVGIDWPVVVAGDPARPRGAEGELTGVRLLGPVPFPELAGWMARAAVFALPARYEPFGLAALEAGLAGCALVLGDIPSLREVWGDAALFVDPDDDDALAATLLSLAADPARRRHLGERARDRAAGYTPERTASGYLDLYASLPVSTGGGR